MLTAIVVVALVLFLEALDHNSGGMLSHWL
jgi:hypothetical protein